MSTVVVIETATDPAVSYEELKAHLRFYEPEEPDEGQEYIMALEAAAEQHLGAPFGWLGRSISSQVLELRTCGFGWSRIELPYGQVTEILSVKYDDDQGFEQTVDPAIYLLSGGSSLKPWITLKSGSSWPVATREPESVRIAYRAGYEPDQIPAPIKHAILLLVSHWYESREAAVLTATQIADLPFAVQALASPFRIWSI